MKRNGSALVFAFEEVMADKGVVAAEVKNNGWALEYASEELKADKEVILAAVKSHGSALKYASKELKADKEVKTKDRQRICPCCGDKLRLGIGIFF